MVFLATLGLIVAMLAMYGYFIMDERNRDAAKERDSQLNALLEMAIAKTGVPREIIEATGAALARNLYGSVATSPRVDESLPHGMDSLGFDERAGMTQAAFPDIEYDPWVTQEVQEEFEKIDTSLSSVPVSDNGEES